MATATKSKKSKGVDVKGLAKLLLRVVAPGRKQDGKIELDDPRTTYVEVWNDLHRGFNVTAVPVHREAESIEVFEVQELPTHRVLHRTTCIGECRGFSETCGNPTEIIKRVFVLAREAGFDVVGKNARTECIPAAHSSKGASVVIGKTRDDWEPEQEPEPYVPAGTLAEGVDTDDAEILAEWVNQLIVRLGLRGRWAFVEHGKAVPA